MQAIALEKAKDRLTSAKNRLKDLESPKGDYNTARRHWYDFLLTSNAVFSILEQGTKGFKESEKWFAAKRQERKADPLLSYLHHARNAEEHAISSVTALDRQKMVLVEGDKPIAAIEDIVGNTGRFENLDPKQRADLKKITEIRVYPDRAKLIPVRDRGVEYSPPFEHLGSKIEECGPIIVAQLMIKYIEGMVNEAASFVEK